jgi:GntR family transcriptional repressor for pyruvate dehydrogenase complex
MSTTHHVSEPRRIDTIGTVTSDEAKPGGSAGPALGSYRPRYELAAEQIVRLIADLSLRPGDRLPTENDLAARLGTSRTVCARRGQDLVGVRPGHRAQGPGPVRRRRRRHAARVPMGSFFVPTNLDHIFMLFEFRRVQETNAAMLAATRSSPSELRAMEAAVASCRHGHVTGDHAEFDRSDDAFHLSVAAASHNSFLIASVREARMLQRQASVIGLHGIGGHADAAVSEHEAIYRAIRDGDPDAAAHATSEHLDNTLEDYRREIQRRVFG